MAFTRADLPSLTGRTAVVTGANSGIGLHTALELARAGATVTLACRNLTAAERALDRIRASVPGAAVSVAPLDLSSLQSVRDFADGWDGPLDLLVNNAGVMALPSWRASADGYELQFATNHLGHFALTGLLLPALVAAPAPRVVAVSSVAHRTGDASVLFANPAEGYKPMKAYGNSKLANLMFGLEFQRRAVAHSSRVTAAIAHPGVSNTELFFNSSGLFGVSFVRRAASVLASVVLQSAARGAVPSLYAATLAEPGSYSGPRWLGETRGPAVPARISATAADAGLAGQLWDLSEELTGVSYHWS